MNRTWKLMEEMRKVLLPVSFAQRVEYVGGGAKAMIDIPMEHPRFMIKTIRVIPSRETNVEVHVLNSAVHIQKFSISTMPNTQRGILWKGSMI